jgi:hypothetical protein
MGEVGVRDWAMGGSWGGGNALRANDVYERLGDVRDIERCREFALVNI